MLSQNEKNNAAELHQDVSQLADTLDDLLRAYGSKSPENVEAAKQRAHALLKEARSKHHGRCPVTQAARKAGYRVDSYVHQNPWHGVGLGAALGIVIGALLGTTGSHR